VAAVWLRSRKASIPSIPAPVHSDEGGSTYSWLIPPGSRTRSATISPSSSSMTHVSRSGRTTVGEGQALAAARLAHHLRDRRIGPIRSGAGCRRRSRTGPPRGAYPDPLRGRAGAASSSRSAVVPQLDGRLTLAFWPTVCTSESPTASTVRLTPQEPRRGTVTSFPQGEGWCSAGIGWGGGADPAVGVGDLEGGVGEELGVPAGGVEEVVVAGAGEGEVVQ
jgi:hypothetical protein